MNEAIDGEGPNSKNWGEHTSTLGMVRVAIDHLADQFPAEVHDELLPQLQKLRKIGTRGIRRQPQLRSRLRALLDELIALRNDRPLFSLLPQIERYKSDLSLLVEALVAIHDSTGLQPVDVETAEKIQNLASAAVKKEIERYEIANSQAKQMLEELKNGMTRLSSAEDEARRRSSSLIEEVTAALSRINDAEAEGRRAAQELHTAFSNVQTQSALEADNNLQRAQAIVVDLERYRAEAKDLLEVVGENGASAGYKSEAAKSKFSRLVWQILTVVFFCMWICASGAAFYMTRDLELSWALAARQFVVSLPFVLLSAFGALQVSRSNATDLSNQRAALEIHALGPLLAGLPDEDQIKVRGAIIPRFFGTELGGSGGASRTDSRVAPDAAQFLEKLTDLMKVTAK